jgi:hypothetical protein
MLSRALILATVALLIGGFATAPTPVQAQNLEAGKSPSQIFAGTCTACHKSARGLLKTVPPGSLAGFLRQHYTTSPEMAGLLSAFLISNGAADARHGGSKAGRAVGGPSEQSDRPGRRLRGAASQEGAEPLQPEVDGSALSRKGRNAKRLARPADETARPAEGEAAAPAVSKRTANGRKRLGSRGKPGVEAPSKETSKQDDAAKGGSARDEPLKEDKPAAEAAKSEGGKPSADGAAEAAKSEAAKPDAVKPEAAKSEAAKSDAPKSEPVKPEAPKEAGNSQNPGPAVTSAPAAPPSAAASSAPQPAAGQPTSPVPATDK